MTLLDRIQAFAQQNPFPAGPRALYEPCDYILTLGGKRFRPVALLLGYQLFRDELDTALPAAWAVELVHNVSLIHDDIMDAAPLPPARTLPHTAGSPMLRYTNGRRAR